MNEYVALKMIKRSDKFKESEILIKHEIEALSKIPNSISPDDDFNYIIRFKCFHI